MANINLKKKNYLKIEACDQNFAETVENVLRIRFPEAEITKGKNGDTFLLKKNWLDRLRIITDENLQSEESYIKVNFDDPVKGGCLYCLFGFWSNIVQRFVSQRFKNEVIDELGRDLGTRYKAKAEYVEGWLNSALGLFFFMACAIVALFFLFKESISYSYIFNWLEDLSSDHNVVIIEAILYPFVAWLCFIIMWFRRRWIDKKTYIILPVTCIIGWILFCCAHNMTQARSNDKSQNTFESFEHYKAVKDSLNSLINPTESYYDVMKRELKSDLVMISKGDKYGVISWREYVDDNHVIVPVEYQKIERNNGLIVATKYNGEDDLYTEYGHQLTPIEKLNYKTGIIGIGLHVIAYLLLIAACYLFYRLSNGKDRRGQQSRIIYMP